MHLVNRLYQFVPFLKNTKRCRVTLISLATRLGGSIGRPFTKNSWASRDRRPAIGEEIKPQVVPLTRHPTQVIQVVSWKNSAFDTVSTNIAGSASYPTTLMGRKKNQGVISDCSHFRWQWVSPSTCQPPALTQIFCVFASAASPSTAAAASGGF